MTAPATRTKENKPAARRVGTSFSYEELIAVDDWGFARRIRDRAEVIRTLVKRGLAADHNIGPESEATTEGSLQAHASAVVENDTALPGGPIKQHR